MDKKEKIEALPLKARITLMIAFIVVVTACCLVYIELHDIKNELYLIRVNTEGILQELKR